MTRVAIIAAIPGELKPLVRGWDRVSRNGVEIWSGRDGEDEWVAACAGLGVTAAKRALAEIESRGAVDCVISAGWAGALRETCVAGRAYRVSGVIDARTGERTVISDASPECSLITADRVADSSAKQRFAAEYGASLVDMEAAGLARVAALRGIPFLCVKGVSDSVADPLPDFNRFISAEGRFQVIGFVLHTIVRPWQWPVLARMGQNSRKAAQCMGEELLHLLEERKTLRGPACR